MKFRVQWLCLLSILTIVLLTLIPGPSVKAQEGPNLLTNGDFESGGSPDWPWQDGIPEVQIAPGWRAFWVDPPRPSYAVAPSYCNTDPNPAYCAWGRPEFRSMKSADFANRVHSGFLAQKIHSFNRQMEAGLYQQVGGITPGTRLRFQAWVQTWSCAPGEQWNVCPTAPYSNSPAPMHVRVGIDPTGGTNPWAGTVVWSGEGNAWDQWTLFQVEAVAQADTVTVFIYHRTDWADGMPRVNNDVYIDDASLVALGQAPPTPPPPPPTSASGPAPAAWTPLPQPTPRPDGCRVHIVQPGDTLFGIALQYGIPMEDLERLNAGSLGPNKMIFVGQELVLSCPTATPTPEATPTPVPTPTPEAGQVCVQAFHDRNGDGVRQPETEELLPNAVFSLSDATGLVGQYTTDGISEPYCFPGLKPGTYQVAVQPPAGYGVNGPAQVALALASGGRLEAAMPLQRGGAGGATPVVMLPTPSPQENPGGQISIWARFTRWLARVVGSVIVHWVAGIAGIFFIGLAMFIPVRFVLSHR
jgi:hypothetical protein